MKPKILYLMLSNQTSWLVAGLIIPFSWTTSVDYFHFSLFFSVIAIVYSSPFITIIDHKTETIYFPKDPAKTITALPNISLHLYSPQDPDHPALCCGGHLLLRTRVTGTFQTWFVLQKKIKKYNATNYGIIAFIIFYLPEFTKLSLMWKFVRHLVVCYLHLR